MKNPVYLRSDVYFEPLYNNWFLWPYLLAPATAAMNLANHQIKLMKSFVANAKIHQKASGNKALSGSSLVNISADRIQEVRALLDDTIIQNQDLIAFAHAVKDLDAMLREKAVGHSMEELYEEVPEPLRGLVELHYDLNNQPSFRFFESLLYRTPIFKKSSQILSLGNLRSDERPFVLSTPRLADENHLHIHMPFDHEFVSRLFKMRDEPVCLEDIKAQLDEFDTDGTLPLGALFTSEAPVKTTKPIRQGAEVRYLGHAGLMLRTSQACVMVDPVISYTNDDETNKTTFDDLPQYIDAVMVTHSHMDHVCLETLLQLKHKIGVILVPKNNSGLLADPSIRLMLQSIGFDNVIEMEDLDEYQANDICMTALPFLGEHADVNIRSKAAWLMEAQGQKILAAADASNLDSKLYQRLHGIIGDVDMLFIGMECKGGPLKWLYGPLLTQNFSREVNESRRFNGSDFNAASQIASAFNASQVYVYALGIEPWFAYFMGISYKGDDIQLLEARKLIEFCQRKNVHAECLEGIKIWQLPAA